MKDHPTYFENCLPSQLDMVFAEQINTMTESRDEYGRRVYIFRPGRWNPRYVAMIQKLKSSDFPTRNLVRIFEVFRSEFLKY